MSRVSILSALDRIRSTSAREQKDGLADLRHLFAAHSIGIAGTGSPFDSFEKHEWRLVLDTLFDIVVADREWIRRRTGAAAAGPAGRLAQAAAVLRLVAAAMAPRLAGPLLWAAKMVIDHVSRVVIVADGLCQPVLLDYLRVLAAVVAEPAVVERLRDRWAVVADLAVSVSERLIPASAPTTTTTGNGQITGSGSGSGSAGASSQDGSRASELAELAAILRRLTTAPNGPVAEHADRLMSVLTSLLTIRRGLVDVVAAIANLLDRATERLSDVAPHMATVLARLRPAWGRDRALRDEVVRLLLVGRHVIVADSGLAAPVRALVSTIMAEYSTRPDRDQIRIEDIDMTVRIRPCNRPVHPLAAGSFGLRRLGCGDGKAAAWLVPWLLAFFVVRLAGLTLPDGAGRSKRLRLSGRESPVTATTTMMTAMMTTSTPASSAPLDMLTQTHSPEVITPPAGSEAAIDALVTAIQASPARILPVQIIAMLPGQIDNPPAETVGAVLSALVGIVSAAGPRQSPWAFLAAANWSAVPVASSPALRHLWTAVVAQAVRRGGRAGSVAVAAVSQLNRPGLDLGLAAGQIGVWDLTDGPVGLAESAVRAEIMAGADTGLSDRLVGWAAEKWSGMAAVPDLSARPLIDLFLACAGQARVGSRLAGLALLPDAVSRSWVRAEADRPVVDFLLSYSPGRLLRYSEPTRPATEGDGGAPPEWPDCNVAVMRRILIFWAADLGRISRLLDHNRDRDRDDDFADDSDDDLARRRKRPAGTIAPLTRYAVVGLITAWAVAAHAPSDLSVEADQVRASADELANLLFGRLGPGFAGTLDDDAAAEQTAVVMAAAEALPDITTMASPLSTLDKAGVLSLLLRLAAVLPAARPDDRLADLFARDPGRRTDEGVHGSREAVYEYVVASARLAACSLAEGDDRDGLETEDKSQTRWVVPAGLVAHLTALPSVRFVHAVVFTIGLTNNRYAAIMPARLADILTRVGTAMLQDGQMQLCEPAVSNAASIVAGIASRIDGQMASSAEGETVNGLVDDLAEWLTSAALRPAVSSRAAHAKIIGLVTALRPGRVESVSDSALVGLIRTGPMASRVRAAAALPALFPRLNPAGHESVFRAVYDGLPDDACWPEAIAVRAFALAILAARCPAVRRRAVFHLIETGVIAGRHVGPLLNWVVSQIASPSLKTGHDLVRLYSAQISHTWLASGRSLDSLPFEPLGYGNLAGIVTTLLPDLAARAISQSDPGLLKTLSAMVALSKAEMGEVAFIPATAQLVSDADGSTGSMAGLVGLIGSVRLSALVDENAGGVIGLLLARVDRPENAFAAVAASSSSTAWTAEAEARWAALDPGRDRYPLDGVALAALQQPNCPADAFLPAVRRLCVVAFGTQPDGPAETVFSWPAPVYSAILRALVDHIEPASGFAAMLAVVQRIRLLIAVSGQVAVTGYPLEMAIAAVAGTLNHAVAAAGEPVAGALAAAAAATIKFLIGRGMSDLVSMPSRFASLAVPLAVAVRTGLLAQPAMTADSILQKPVELTDWLVLQVRKVTVGTVGDQQVWTRASDLIAASCQIGQFGTAAKARIEGQLLVFILDDMISPGPILTAAARETTLLLLLSRFTVPDNRRDDIVRSQGDLARVRYVEALWQIRHLGGPEFAVWVGRVVGSVSKPCIDAGSVAIAGDAAPANAAAATESSRASIMAGLCDLLGTTDSGPGVGTAETAVRQILSRLPTVPDGVTASVAAALTGRAWIGSGPARTGGNNTHSAQPAVGIDRLADAVEQVRRVGMDDSVPASVWARRLVLAVVGCHKLADSQVDEWPLEAVIKPVEQIDGLAARLLGPIVHLVLSVEIAPIPPGRPGRRQSRKPPVVSKQATSVQSALTDIFTYWFTRARDELDVDPADTVEADADAVGDDGKTSRGEGIKPVVALLLDLLLFLRLQPCVAETSFVDRSWVSIDPVLAAFGAMLCGLPVRALFLAELDPEAGILASPLYRRILPALPEPDSRYALPQLPGLDAVLARLGPGPDAGPVRLMVHAARVEAHVRAGGPIQPADAAGVDRALAEMGVAGAGLPDWPLYRRLRSIGHVATAREETSAAIHQLVSANTSDQTRPGHLDRLVVLAEISEVLDSAEAAIEASTRAWTDLTGPLPDPTVYSILAVNRELTLSANISTSTAVRAEVGAVLRHIRACRATGRLQQALSAVQYLGLREGMASEVGIHISSVVRFETAAILWERGERDVSVAILHQVREAGPGDGEFGVSKAVVLAKLAHHLDIARLEQPDQIISKYLTPAVDALGLGKDKPDGGSNVEDAVGLETRPADAAAVFHQFGLFCDSQLRAHDHLEHIAQLKKAVRRRRADAAAADALLRSSSKSRSKVSGPSARALAAHRHASRTWAEIDRRELERVKTAWLNLLRLAIENYGRALAMADNHDGDVLKLLALWLEYADVGPATDAVRDVAGSIPSAKWMSVMHQLTSRLSTADADSADFQHVLGRIVLGVCVDHGLVGMHFLYAACQTDGRPAGSSTSGHAPAADGDPVRARADAASKISAELAAHPTAAALWKRVRAADSAYHSFASSTADSSGNPFKGGTEVALERIPHARFLVKLSVGLPLPTMTVRFLVGAGSAARPAIQPEIPTIATFRTRVLIAQGLSAPKIIVARLTDGREQKVLVKGGSDDLRQDAVMEQVFAHASAMLAAHPATSDRSLAVRTYAVVPLSATTGLIEFVSNTVSFNDYLTPAHLKFRPNDVTAADCRARIASAGSADVDSRIQVFEEVCAAFKPVLRYFFYEIGPTPEAWFGRRLAYIRSTAAISILGHVLGLGDRHGQNILLDKLSGAVVHIDLGVAFDAGRVLPVPELVPFRLTRDVVDPFGAAGVDGVFRRCCEAVLDALRRERDSVRTLLDVLRYDPLHQWTVTARQAGRVQADGTTNSRNAAVVAAASSNHTDDDEDGGPEEEANRALGAVERKLSADLSVAAAVNELVVQAMDPRNLAVLFAGWGAYL